MGSLLEITRSHFREVGQALINTLHPQEELGLNLHFENSTFVRFNHSKVRQSGCVEQSTLTLLFQSKGRSLKYTFGLTGNLNQDIELGFECLQQARHDLPHVPEDPFLISFSNNGESFETFKGRWPDQEITIATICEAIHDQDFVGLYTSGPMASGHMNSAGQQHWFSTESFFLDYSLYHQDRASKGLYSALSWETQHLQNHIADTSRHLEILKRPKIKIPRGHHRVFLAPAAVADLTEILAWGALSYSQAQRGDSGLHKVFHKERQLSPLVTVRENFNLGLSPRFTSLGEMAPMEINLIKHGEIKNLLVSTRSGKEYTVASNQAVENETPRSLEFLPGQLTKNQIFEGLETGIYISNLHYLNWSDVLNGRFTGMTRFACFWVENQEIMGPIEDMRFDVSLLDCLGPQLLGVTNYQEVFPNVMTYGARHSGGCKVPGLLVDRFHFSL